MPMISPSDYLTPALAQGRPEPPEDSLQAIYLASASGDIEKVRELVEAGHRSQEYLNHGLVAAVAEGRPPRGYPELVRYLLQQGAEINGATPVFALKSQSSDVFQVLLDFGWDINSLNGNAGPVFPSVISNEALLRWFLDHGADPNVRSPHYTVTALDSAAASGNIQTVDLLFRHGAKLENSLPLHAAASSPATARDPIAMMAYFLDLGVDINADDLTTNGYHAIGTPLNAAVNIFAIDRIRFLVSKGAEVNEKAIKVARQRAINNGRSDIVSFLEKAREAQGGAAVSDTDL